MKRWLSLLKKRVTPGNWTQPVKKRRPITMMTQATVAAETAPLRIVKRVSRPLCDTNLILDRYYNRDDVTRASSQALPLCDCFIPREAYRNYAFIDFGPTYKVTVSEIVPHRLELTKPRPARCSTRVASYFRELCHGEI